MANKTHYDNRAKARQTVRTMHPLHMYTQRVPTSFMVERFLARQSRISISDWNAALPDEPFICSGEAWRSGGLGAVIDWPRPDDKLKHEPVPPITLVEQLRRGVDNRLPRTETEAKEAAA